MSNKPPVNRAKTFEKSLEVSASSPEHYVLKLYVTGSTPRSTKAIQDIRAFCENNLTGNFELEVIDIHQQPLLARSEQIIAAPTLIKEEPLPLRKLIGDLSNTERIRANLNMPPTSQTGAVH
ncbi:MAG TPA: circadian clock KaiB family protein [Tepidisphaeraceae bacterium]|nr:circadian clock KaiB family protein [Tepidisphaeraceae bacterium]